MQFDLNLEKLTQLQELIRNGIQNINLKEVINWTTCGWSDVSEQTIQNYFSKSGFSSSDHILSTEDIHEVK